MRLLAIVVFAFAFNHPVSAQNGEEVNRRRLQLSEPSSTFWEETSQKSPVQISDDDVLVAGQLNDPAFGIKRIENVRLVDASGKEISLNVDESSLFREFGEIVSCLIYFRLPAETLQKDSVSLVLEWGEEIQGDNQLVSKFRVPEQTEAAFREFELTSVSQGDKSSDASVTTIEVIADSKAKYYSLWYLLPITLIFVLLTVRKLAIRNESES